MERIAMFFRSERLFLRPVWPEDWQAIHSAIADEAVVKNLARAPWPYGEADAQVFAGLERDPYYPDCLILRRDSAAGAEVIGGIGLARHEQGAELGYWIARRHWGHGYASEAARAMLALAQVAGHRRIVAHHFVDNPASGRVLARAGFRPTGGVVAQPCLARGGHVQALAYARELGAADDGSDGMRKRAA
jgi:RimJ/RimL family protein N-acetyltransferase